MAGEEGFEPSQTESESVVLPLHNSPISLSAPTLYHKKIGLSISILNFFENFFYLLWREFMLWLYQYQVGIQGGQNAAT